MFDSQFGARIIFLMSTGLCSFVLADTLPHREIGGEPVASGRFTLLREPSGITALDEQTLMVVEDEASDALRRLTISSDDASTFSFQEFDQQLIKGPLMRLAPLDDLEGIARVSSKEFIIIGSHENASQGMRPDREKILLLSRDGDDVVSTFMRTDLFDQLSARFPELANLMNGCKKGDKCALNIEGITFDRHRQILHIGLRAPLKSGKAIIISLTNAIDYLRGAEPIYSDKLHYLDLDAGGIRALAYDDLSDTLFIVSKRILSTLWALDASMTRAAIPYASRDRNLFEDVEGLTAVAKGFLFVRDGGKKKKKAGDQWFFLERSQLGFDD